VTLGFPTVHPGTSFYKSTRVEFIMLPRILQKKLTNKLFGQGDSRLRIEHSGSRSKELISNLDNSSAKIRAC
jgi:hypothetical protein